jgi:acyl-CoA synthetase (NDP forming)
MALTETEPVDDLDRLFDPDSVALVGASSDPEKLSGRPFRFLQEYGFDGDVYLVNPSTDRIDGKRCYDSVSEIPAAVDLAMVLVPARLTTQMVEECGRNDIPYAMLIASGYAETGAEGEKLEAELLETARENGVRLVGPNSEGMINLVDTVPLSFSSILKRDDLEPGGVSFVTQSGAFGGALFQLSQNMGIGTSKWISTGNETDITTLDYLEYLVDDPETDLIVTYIESLEDGRRLLDIGRRAAENGTAILSMRAGVSPEGKEAAASHTGSIATGDEIYDAVFRQAGITRIWSVDEFVDAISAFDALPQTAYPRFGADGEGLGVISMSGGAAVLIADTAHRKEVPLATLTEATRETIREEIPAYGSETNPVDVTAAAVSDPEVFNTCIGAVLSDPNVSGLLIQFGNSGGDIVEGFKDDLLRLREESGQAMATIFTGNPPVPETAAELRNGGILVYEDPVRSVQTMKNLTSRSRFLDRYRSGAKTAIADGVDADVDFASREPLATDEWSATVDAFESIGVPFAESSTARTAEEAVAAADEIGYPVVLKLDPLRTEHKSERGGVKPGLETPSEVREAFETLSEIADGPVVVQEMIDGSEAIVGVVDDPDFGPVLLIGAGGVFVELFDEFEYRALPVSAEEAREMIEQTPLDTLLSGFRNRPPGDVDALAAAVAAVSDAYCRYDVDELEINPLIVSEEGAFAVDLLVD